MNAIDLKKKLFEELLTVFLKVHAIQNANTRKFSRVFI